MSADINKLAERCEAATGPDRVIDGLVHVAANPDTPWIIGHEPGRFPRKAIYGTLSDFRDALLGENGADFADAINAPAYTASIDAAMTLVPEGVNIGLHIDHNGCDCAWSSRAIGWQPRVVPGNTPALALCAAALRARAALSTTPDLSRDEGRAL